MTVVVSEVVVTVVELSEVTLSSGSVLQEETDAHKEAVSNKLMAFFVNSFLFSIFFIRAIISRFFYNVLILNERIDGKRPSDNYGKITEIMGGSHS